MEVAAEKKLKKLQLKLHCHLWHTHKQHECAPVSMTLYAHICRDINKDKSQNPRPRTWPSLPRPRTWASWSRPRTLFPQGLFKDLCRIKVLSFITLFYVGLNVHLAIYYVIRNPLKPTFKNTMMIVKTWHNVTKCSNKLLYTLGVFGVAGQTKALSYWWIGFLEILHWATSHHTCQCENLRLLSQSVNRASHKTFCAHHAIGRNANRTVKLKGAPFWS